MPASASTPDGPLPTRWCSASALIPVLVGRPSDAVTAAITTAVPLPLSQLSPHHAWEQPILRLADTIVGVAVGIAAAWLGRRLIGSSASSKAS